MRNPSVVQNLAALQRRRDEGEPVPLLDRIPKPELGSEWLWQAYMLLAAKRLRFHTEPQPIQVTEIKAYADYLGIDDEFRRALLFHIVSVLDQVYLQDWRQRQERQRK